MLSHQLNQPILTDIHSIAFPLHFGSSRTPGTWSHMDITQAPPPKIGFETNQRGPSSRLDSLHIVTSP